MVSPQELERAVLSDLRRREVGADGHRRPIRSPLRLATSLPLALKRYGVLFLLGLLVVAVGVAAGYFFTRSRRLSRELAILEQRNRFLAQRLERLEKARREFADWQIEVETELIEADPGAVNALIARGRELLNTDRLEEAIADLERAATLAPDDPRAHFYLGRSYLRRAQQRRSRDEQFRRDVGKAARELARAVELEQNFPTARLYLGVAHFQLGEYEQALAEFEAYVERKPDSALGMWLMAHANYRLGRKEKARELFREARTRDPALDIPPELEERRSGKGKEEAETSPPGDASG